MKNADSTLLTESQALRRLDLPHSRREDLRTTCSSQQVGRLRLYDAKEVERAGRKLCEPAEAK